MLEKWTKLNLVRYYGITGSVLFVSLIHTTERCGGNSFEYMVALLKNEAAVQASPSDWMPWNYIGALDGQ